MSILNSLLVQFPLTPETATMQAALVDKITGHNAECDSIAQAEAELKDTLDSDWTADHSKAVTKVRERKLKSLHEELSIRQGIGDYLTRVITIDYQLAQNDANAAAEDAKQKATAYLVAGGWVATKTEIANGVQLLPIDYHVLMRNREVCQTELANSAMSQTSLIAIRQDNGKAIESLKERFAAIKAKAMSLSA